jgi:hypothetical protein
VKRPYCHNQRLIHEGDLFYYTFIIGLKMTQFFFLNLITVFSVAQK